MSEMYVDRLASRIVIGEAALHEAASGTLMGDYDFDVPPNDATNPNIVPLAHALNSPDFPSASSANPNRISGWTNQDMVDSGVIVARHLRDHVDKTGDKNPVLLTDKTAAKLHVLGLLPSVAQIYDRFGRWSDYKAKIDGGISPTIRSRFRDWSDKEWKQYAKQVDGRLDHHPPRAADYIKADAKQGGPSLYIITKVFGTHGELNELIGYPNVLTWQQPEAIDWGVKLAEVNGVERITRRLIIELSKRGYGPSFEAIQKLFPMGIPSFRNAIKTESSRKKDANDRVASTNITLSPADYVSKLKVTNEQMGIIGRHGYSNEPWSNKGNDSTINDLSKGVSDANEKVHESLNDVKQAEMSFTDAQTLLLHAVEGSHATDTDEAVQAYNIVLQRLTELQQSMGLIVTKLSTISSHL